VTATARIIRFMLVLLLGIDLGMLLAHRGR
jgi:hypothetical protein